jgi:hypothetical protein
MSGAVSRRGWLAALAGGLAGLFAGGSGAAGTAPGGAGGRCRAGTPPARDGHVTTYTYCLCPRCRGRLAAGGGAATTVTYDPGQLARAGAPRSVTTYVYDAGGARGEDTA